MVSYIPVSGTWWHPSLAGFLYEILYTALTTQQLGGVCIIGMSGKTPKDVLLVWARLCCYGCLGLQEIESGIAVALNALKPAPHHAMWSPFTDFPWSLLSTVVSTLQWAQKQRYIRRKIDQTGSKLVQKVATRRRCWRKRRYVFATLEQNLIWEKLLFNRNSELCWLCCLPNVCTVGEKFWCYQSLY